MGNHHEHHHTNKNGLSLAFWLNAVFSVIEVVGGILTNSTAILADAFHDFTDAAAIGLAVILEKISGKKRTARFSYGFRRFSVLSAMAMSLFLLTGAIVMSINAIQSFINPSEVNSIGMLWLAILGIAINGLAFLRIKKSNTSHEHNHSHGSSQNHNSKAIMLHLLEDVLGWVAVFIGAIVIYFTGWFWIDPLLAIAIAIFIGFNATRNLISVTRILLQSVPENVDIQRLSTDLQAIEGIDGIHDLHIWSLDGNYNICSLHMVVNNTNLHLRESIHLAVIGLMDKYNIQHPTLQLETTENGCRLATC
jgi:cobalt-zinc-cadmium efflux system protein